MHIRCVKKINRSLDSFLCLKCKPETVPSTTGGSAGSQAGRSGNVSGSVSHDVNLDEVADVGCDDGLAGPSSVGSPPPLVTECSSSSLPVACQSGPSSTRILCCDESLLAETADVQVPGMSLSL